MRSAGEGVPEIRHFCERETRRPLLSPVQCTGQSGITGAIAGRSVGAEFVGVESRLVVSSRSDLDLDL